jgi:rsbT co-antagonist protein RsbR
MTERLLGEIAATRFQHVIIDLTGAEVAGDEAAQNLLRTVRAVKLLGASALITGIKPSVARDMVALGSDLSQVQTLSSLRDALKLCMKG